MDNPLIDKSYSYAIVGASRDPEKYGHRVLVDLEGSGYSVYPINPYAQEVAGQRAYADIASCLQAGNQIDIAVFVVPPQVVLEILPTLAGLGITKVWCQPGSESEEVIDYCEQHGLEFSVEKCIMVERPKP